MGIDPGNDILLLQQVEQGSNLGVEPVDQFLTKTVVGNGYKAGLVKGAADGVRKLFLLIGITI